MNAPVWKFRPYDLELAGIMAERLGISITLAILLQQRGCRTEEQCRRFLSPSWEELTSPCQMHGMNAAVQIIADALQAKHSIVIYGDYDVDGVCSTVILLECLQTLGARVDYYIPDRFQEGYGLNVEAMQRLAEQGYRLLITVDCGIRSIDEVAAAKGLGLKVVITDHHVPGDILPEAEAIVNPQLDNSNTGCRKLCGAGVAFQLARALGIEPEGKLWLDLVALATVADLVDLTEDNRILVRSGLECLASSTRPGLKALMEICGIKPEERLSAWQIGFILAPRLNAAGRLDHARLSVELLHTPEEQQAYYLAETLHRLNEERKRTEEIILREVALKIARQPALLERTVLIVDGSAWHHGVLGIVASRLCEEHRKPVILISWEDDIGRGSCRSIEGFDINAALQACRSHLLQFGGHPMAAGLTIEKSKLAAFEESVQYWTLQHIPEVEKQMEHYIDVELTSAEVDCGLWQEIQALEPFGSGNPAPVLAVRGAALEQAAMVGSQGQHFKARLQGTELGVIAFGKPYLADFKSSHFRADISFQLDRNQFRGRTSLQLKVRQMRPAYQTEAQSVKSLPEWLATAIAVLERQQTAVITVPTCRVADKLRQYLELWFCDAALYSLHGRLPFARRQAGEKALLAGGPAICLMSSAYSFYLQRKGLTWGLAHTVDLQAIAEAAVSTDSGEGSNPAAPNPLSMAHPIVDGEMLPLGRYAVYVNRPKTMRAWNQRQHVFNEIGLNDIKRRRQMRMQFTRSACGYLLTDGRACGAPVKDLDGIWLADLPFSNMEISQLFLEFASPGDVPLVAMFKTQQVEANWQYLQGLYPDMETLQPLYQALREMHPQALQGGADSICQTLSAVSAMSFSPRDLKAHLQVLVELGLCQVKKKGSIMAIKLVPQAKTSFDTADSPYYLEGQAEKEAFRQLVKNLRLIPLE